MEDNNRRERRALRRPSRRYSEWHRTYLWLRNWMIWVVLVACETFEHGRRYPLIIELTTVLGAVAFGTALFHILLFAVTGEGIAAVTASFGAYLLLGVVVFFAVPRTNEEVHWTDNGGW